MTFQKLFSLRSPVVYPKEGVPQGPSSASILDTCTLFGDNLAHFRCFCCYLFIADDSKITPAQTISLGLEHPASGYVFPQDVSQDV